MKINKWILLGIFFFAALIRFVPHPPNFTPVIAISVLSVALFDKKQLQFGFPLLIMLLTDAVLGFHKLIPFVYASLVLAGLSGYVLKRKVSTFNMLGASVVSSITFFLLSNFSVWLVGSLYPKTWAGLLQCYTMAIPFFHNTLLSTGLILVLMYAMYQLLLKSYQKLQLKKFN